MDRRVPAGTRSVQQGQLRALDPGRATGDEDSLRHLPEQQLAPRVIVRGPAADHEAANALIKAHPALSTTPAVKNGRIIRMDGLLLLGFGPRTGEAITELAEALYGHEH